MERLLIKDAQIWNGQDLVAGDILLDHAEVLAVGQNLQDDDADVFYATGCLATPGFTDLHVHLRQPGFEAKETIASGTLAALAGGFTTVCAMPNLNPVPDSPAHLQPQLLAIEENAHVRVLPFGAITKGEKGESLADLAALAPFVPGYTDDGRGVQKEALMREAMQKAAALGRLVAAHCEVESLLPKGYVCVQENSSFTFRYDVFGVSNKSESAEVERNIRLCEETGCRLHICHTSAADSFELIRKAKKQGLPVTCEVSPHHLLLNCEDIPGDDGSYKMNPPLRHAEDQAAALAALLDGTVDAIATDHAPHTDEDKAGGFKKAACGIPGLETAFPLLYTAFVETGKLPLEKLLPLFTSGPRRVLLEAQPMICAGQEADFTLIDLTNRRQVRREEFITKGRSTPFDGYVLKGWPLLTVWGEHAFSRSGLV